MNKHMHTLPDTYASTIGYICTYCQIHMHTLSDTYAHTVGYICKQYLMHIVNNCPIVGIVMVYESFRPRLLTKLPQPIAEIVMVYE